MRVRSNWRLRTRTLEVGRRTLVMGVVNITPDSFSDGGFFLDAEKAVAHALQLAEEGADVLDLGAESTRPGSRAGGGEAHARTIDPAANEGPFIPTHFRQGRGNGWGTDAVSKGRIDHDESPSMGAPVVSADEEQARLLPVVEGILKALPHAVLSVDTYKAATARAALRAGAEIVNDVSGFTWDREMAGVCAEFGAGVVLSQTRGRPEEWSAQAQLAPDALLAAVREGLAANLAAAQAAGLAAERMVLDPGYGFGKRFGENYALLNRQAELLALGRPLLAGVSRKSFLGRTLAPLFGGDAPPGERENASLAAMTAAILHGASLVRVHRVRAAVEAARIADAVLAEGGE